MAKTKKVAPSPVDKKVYDVETTYYDYDDKTGSNGHKISVNKYIPYQEMGALIHSIVDTIIDDNGYYPYVKSIGLWGNIIEEYTNYNGSYAVDDLIRLLAETNIITVLEESISAYQLGMIVKSVDKLIEYRKQHSIKSEIDDINSIQDIAPDIKRLLNKFETITDMVSVLIEKASANVNFGAPEIVGAAMSNLAKMTNVSEKDIIKALVEESGVAKSKGGRPKSNAKGKNKVVPFPEPELDGQVDIDGKVYNDVSEDNQ